MQHHHYSLSDVESMMPWEREIYLMLLTDHIKQQNEDAERQRLRNGNAF